MYEVGTTVTSVDVGSCTLQRVSPYMAPSTLPMCWFCRPSGRRGRAVRLTTGATSSAHRVHRRPGRTTPVDDRRRSQRVVGQVVLDLLFGGAGCCPYDKVNDRRCLVLRRGHDSGIGHTWARRRGQARSSLGGSPELSDLPRTYLVINDPINLQLLCPVHHADKTAHDSSLRPTRQCLDPPSSSPGEPTGEPKRHPTNELAWFALVDPGCTTARPSLDRQQWMDQLLDPEDHIRQSNDCKTDQRRDNRDRGDPTRLLELT